MTSVSALPPTNNEHQSRANERCTHLVDRSKAKCYQCDDNEYTETSREVPESPLVTALKQIIEMDTVHFRQGESHYGQFAMIASLALEQH